MKILCPKCRRGIQAGQDEPVWQCGHCHFAIDRRTAGLASGPASLSLVRDLRGEPLGPYVVHDLIGLRTAGAVYTASKQPDGPIVCLTVLHHHPLRKADFLARVKPMLKAWPKLRHPHIARVLDFGRHGDLYYFVSEYVEGVTLGHYMRSFTLEWPEVRSIMGQLGAALASAHNVNVPHLGLNPGEVVMGQGTLKVLNFGLAHVASPNGHPGGVPTPAAFRHVNYLAPEQRFGDGPADHRADIFALGAMFYEMLTGRPPVGAHRSPGETRTALGRRCDGILERALAPDPEQRYQRVEDFIADLNALDERPPAASRTPLRLVLILLAGLSMAVYLWPRWDDIRGLFGL